MKHKIPFSLLLWILPAIFWLVTVWIGCTIPLQLPAVSTPFFHTDKIVHLIMFMGMTFLFAFGFQKQIDVLWLQQNAILVAFCIGFSQSCLTEIVQIFLPNRMGDLYDLVADSSGCLIGIGLKYYWIR